MFGKQVRTMMVIPKENVSAHIGVGRRLVGKRSSDARCQHVHTHLAKYACDAYAGFDLLESFVTCVGSCAVVFGLSLVQNADTPQRKYVLFLNAEHPSDKASIRPTGTCHILQEPAVYSMLCLATGQGQSACSYTVYSKMGALVCKLLNVNDSGGLVDTRSRFPKSP
jgi:hypothetical protein